MQSWSIIGLAVALFLACFLPYAIVVDIHTHAEDCPDFSHMVRHVLSYIPCVLLASTKTNSFDYFRADKRDQSQKAGDEKLSIFKGREAKLNRVILLILFRNSPLVVYDITKEVKKKRGFRFTKYTNVNRRVRALAQQGYLESAGTRNTQAGSQGTLYQPTMRAKVAFYLTAINPDQFIKEANDQALITELAALALFLEKKCSKNMSF
jgi:hypothetical protein